MQKVCNTRSKITTSKNYTIQIIFYTKFTQMVKTKSIISKILKISLNSQPPSFRINRFSLFMNQWLSYFTCCNITMAILFYQCGNQYPQNQFSLSLCAQPNLPQLRHDHQTNIIQCFNCSYLQVRFFYSFPFPCMTNR